MSLADHRPRRIIAGTPPPMPQPALDAALAAQQHRFQRVLLAAPPAQRQRPERPFVEWPLRQPAQPQPRPQPEPPRTVADAPAEKNAPARAAPHRESTAVAAQPSAAPPAPNAAQPATTASAPRPRRSLNPRTVTQRPAVAVPELPPRRDLLADPDAWKHAGLAKPAPEDWDVDLANRITALCQRAAPSFHAWSVTVPLDAAVLPDTELHLALSRERLGLRFQTLSPYSMALIERHQHRLVALLQRTLPGSREIDVELS